MSIPTSLTTASPRSDIQAGSEMSWGGRSWEGTQPETWRTGPLPTKSRIVSSLIGGVDAEGYSYLSDSTGSTLAALRAGKNPAQKPMSVRMPVVSAIVVAERTG